MRGGLSHLLNLIRRMGGRVVFEEFLGEANRLAEALERLRGGEHGVCEECAEPITPARLRATPDVTTCLGCQGRLEQSARRLQAGFRHPDVGT
jgi:hypothetical protein